MEIFAALKGLELLKQPCSVTLYSDSQYLVKAVTEGRAEAWKKKDWWRTNKERASNVDLWTRLLTLCGTHEVEFRWVRGHAGNAENERCDQLSMAALRGTDLPADDGYENKTEDTGGRPPLPEAGQACWKCATPVVRQEPRKRKVHGDYYYEYYLRCPNCQATYTVEAAKRSVELPLPLL